MKNNQALHLHEELLKMSDRLRNATTETERANLYRACVALQMEIIQWEEERQYEIECILVKVTNALNEYKQI